MTRDARGLARAGGGSGERRQRARDADARHRVPPPSGVTWKAKKRLT
jgi:hypothetical protein